MRSTEQRRLAQTLLSYASEGTTFTSGAVAHNPVVAYADGSPLMLDEDDDLIHIDAHNEILLDDTVPWLIREPLAEHVRQHRERYEQKAMAEAMMAAGPQGGPSGGGTEQGGEQNVA